MAKTSKNKMKLWRKNAIMFNVVASVKEGKRVGHQGRFHKVRYGEIRPQVSNLVLALMVQAGLNVKGEVNEAE